MALNVILATAISWLLAAVFAQALWHKASRYLEFTGILKQYKLLPDWILVAAAPLIIVTEAIAAASLLFAPTRKEGAVLACLLLLTYAGAMGVNLIRGRRQIDCGCGGPPTPLHEWLVLRNVVLSGGAIWSANVSAQSMDAESTLITVGTTVLLISLYVIANQLIANLAYTRSTA